MSRSTFLGSNSAIFLFSLFGRRIRFKTRADDDISANRLYKWKIKEAEASVGDEATVLILKQRGFRVRRKRREQRELIDEHRVMPLFSWKTNSLFHLMCVP